MAARGTPTRTPTSGNRQNTLYHGTMIDLTDAPDDPIDLTEEDNDVQVVETSQSPEKQADQTPPPPMEPSQPPQIILNHRLNVFPSLKPGECLTPISSTTLQSQQAKPKQPLAVAKQPIRAKIIDHIQKPVQPTAVTKPSQRKPSPQLLMKQALMKQSLNSGANKLVTERVLTKVTDLSKVAYAKLLKSNAEKMHDQWRKSQDELRSTTASHVKITQTAAVGGSGKKHEVWPKLNLHGSTDADPIDNLQSMVDQVEPNAAQSDGGISHVPVLAPCMDTSGQYVLLPTAMLRQMMVPVANNTVSAQPYFIMSDLSGAAQPAMAPIVVQNVENQSNYIRSVINTPLAPTAPSRPVQVAAPPSPPSPPPPPLPPKPTRPFRKTDQHLTMQFSSRIVKRQLDVHRQEIELDPFSNVAVEESESSCVDLTSNDDSALKQEDGQVNGESIDLTDGIAEDPLDDTVPLPETIVMDTVTPIDIGTILQQPRRAIAASAPSEERCFDRELPADCLSYTMRGDKFIGFPRLERERKATCKDIVVELFSENLRSMLKHKKLLRDLDMQALRLRHQQIVSTYVRDGRGQFKKPHPVETPFLPRKNCSNFLPAKQQEQQGEQTVKKKRGRPPGLKTAKVDAPSTSTAAAGQMESKKKYVFSTTEKAAVKYVAKDISAKVPGVKRGKKVKKKPPARPRVEVMTDADNPDEEENDLFVVKKVQILNKDHDVVSLRYNPNCV